jgi:hypothetical protein
MNDPTPTPELDDLIRQSLRAEAGDTQATDALLDRTLAAAHRPAVRPGRRLLAVAAVAAVAIGAGIAVTRDDSDSQTDTVGDPTTSTTVEPPADGLPDLLGALFPCDSSYLLEVFVDGSATEAELDAVRSIVEDSDFASGMAIVPSATVESMLRERYAGEPGSLRSIDSNEIPSAVVISSPDVDVLELRTSVSDLPGVQQVTSFDCLEDTPDGPRPDEVVAVLDDGRLVVLDVESGDIVRELHAMADPRESEGVAEPDPTKHAITDAALSADGTSVYFGTSGGDGGVYRMPVDGSAEPERLTDGWGVSVANDGSFFVFATYDRWGVFDRASGRTVMHDLAVYETTPVLRLSPEGDEVEVISWHMGADVAQVQRVHTLGSDGSVAKTRDGFGDWGTGTTGADGSDHWVLEIIESDDASTRISWGTSSDGLTTAIPNPDALVYRTVDW